MLTKTVFPPVDAVLLLYVRSEKRSVDGSPVRERYAPPPYVDALHPVNAVEVTVILEEMPSVAESAPPLPELLVHALKKQSEMAIEVWHEANSNTPPLPLKRVRDSNRDPLTETLVAYFDVDE